MPDILDFLARTHQPSSHARGRAGTALLLREIDLKDGQNALEIGFGTGQTLVEIAVRWPGSRLFGLEKSALMLRAARRRLRFCGLDGRVALSLAEGEKLPFPDSFFGLIYAESVLGILPDEAIAGMFAEIARVLRPGGVFLNNESLWLPNVAAEIRTEINRRCLASFGIRQAPGRFPFPDDWRDLGEQNGLHLEKSRPLHALEIVAPRRLHPVLLRSALFSGWGKIKRHFLPALRTANGEITRAERSFGPFGRFLEGVLFRFEKR